jgi:hypothetical protein
MTTLQSVLFILLSMDETLPSVPKEHPTMNTILSCQIIIASFGEQRKMSMQVNSDFIPVLG